METSSQEKILIETVKILNNLKINYFITGGFAVSVWGRPRATFDIDIVIKIIETQADKLATAWKSISEAGYADSEMVKNTIKTGGEFNFIDPCSGIKVDFWIAKKIAGNPPEFENKKIKKINGQNIWFISPEDLILNKLQWCKISPLEKHMDDINSVLKISGDILDKKYLNHWIEKLDLEKIEF